MQWLHQLEISHSIILINNRCADKNAVCVGRIPIGAEADSNALTDYSDILKRCVHFLDFAVSAGRNKVCCETFSLSTLISGLNFKPR